MKKRWIALLLVLVLVAGVIRAGSAYFNFVAQTIFDESTAHLTEIFHQANQQLYNLVSVNWSRMRMWAPYIEKTQSDEEKSTTCIKASLSHSAMSAGRGPSGRVRPLMFQR